MKSKEDIYKYKQRVEMNRESLQILEYFRLLSNFNCLAIVSKVEEDGQENQEWQGFIQTIKHFSLKNSRIQKESFEKYVGEKMSSIEKEIKGDIYYANKKINKVQDEMETIKQGQATIIEMLEKQQQ